MSLQQEGDENMTMLLCTLEISDELTTVWDSESTPIVDAGGPYLSGMMHPFLAYLYDMVT